MSVKTHFLWHHYHWVRVLLLRAARGVLGFLRRGELATGFWTKRVLKSCFLRIVTYITTCFLYFHLKNKKGIVILETTLWTPVFTDAYCLQREEPP